MQNKIAFIIGYIHGYNNKIAELKSLEEGADAELLDTLDKIKVSIENIHELTKDDAPKYPNGQKFQKNQKPKFKATLFGSVGAPSAHKSGTST